MSKDNTKERKKREKEARRNVILESAKKLFINLGFENTTMKNIAIEAELSKGSLYNYFKSKDDLYLAVATIAIREINNTCEKIDRTGKTDLEQILSTGYVLYEFSKNHPDLVSIADDYLFLRSKHFFEDIHQKSINGETLNRNEQEIYNENLRYEKLIFDPISKAIDNKSIRDDLSPMLIMATLASLTSGLIYDLRRTEALYENMGVKNDEIIDIVFEWVAEGLKPRKK
ncbi:MAG: TetR/AcrR family transcriptional regulator [Candidatus Hermodarchaeota archaeon]